MKLEINYRKKNGKRTKTWTLKNKLLKKQWVNEENKENSQNTSRQLKMKEQQSKIYGVQQAKVVLRGNFIVIRAFLKKQEKLQINNLTYHLKELEKEKQSPKSAEGRRSERK